MFSLREHPTSSRVHSTGYDPTQQVLVVRLKSRDGVPEPKVRNFRGVPPEIARGFEDGRSVGQHFAFNVNGRFDCDVVAA